MAEWIAYARLEPFGSPTDDLRLGYALAVLGNVVGGGKAVAKDKREAYRTDDFLLRWQPEPQRQTGQAVPRVGPQQLASVMASLGAQMPPQRSVSRG